MNLPDFTRHPGLNELRRKMGIAPTDLELVDQYLTGLITDEEFSLAINDLSDDERIEIRKTLTERGIDEQPRNLYYNYTSQHWIKEGDSL